MVEMEEEEKWFIDIYVTFSVFQYYILSFYFLVIKGTKINHDYWFEFRRERESVNKREKREILFYLDSNSVIIFEKTLTGVVAALECCDRRWLFLRKEKRSKNEEKDVTEICNRRIERNKEEKCSLPWFSEAVLTKRCKELVCNICVL